VGHVFHLTYGGGTGKIAGNCRGRGKKEKRKGLTDLSKLRKEEE